MQSRKFATVVLAGMGAVAFAACSASVSIGSTSVDQAKLEKEVATQLQAQAGTADPPNIDCPNDLKGKVGAVTTCVLSTHDSDDEYNVRVTVTSVKGDDVKFDIKVADSPN